MAQTMNYLSENNLLEYAVLEEKAAAVTASLNDLEVKIGHNLGEQHANDARIVSYYTFCHLQHLFNAQTEALIFDYIQFQFKFA